MFKTALDIGDYLAKYQTGIGLIDLLAKRPIKNSYGNSFYALLCSLIYEKTKKDIWLKRALISLSAELKYIRERKGIRGVFRWEFKNYALINIYNILENHLNDKIKTNLKKAINSWLNTCSFQTNWMAMRALNHYLRYLRFKKTKDLSRSNFELNLLLKRQTKQGFFPDDINHNSFQYHAYILALLYQYYVFSRNKKVKLAFLKGVDFIVPFINPEGDFCYYGRGQKQIFGYASLIYALSGAYRLTNQVNYLKLSQLIFSYTKKFKKYSILLNNEEKHKAGWYAYNNKADYLAFYAVYLFHASSIQKERLGRGIDKSNFLVVADGGKDSAEMGGIANIFPKVIPCQGGPPVFLGKSQKDYSLNFLGPLYKLKNPISGKKAELTKKHNSIRLKYSLADFDLIYSFFIDKGIKLNIQIKPKKQITIIPLHIVCFEKPKTDIKLTKKKTLFTPEGRADVYESKKVRLSGEFECNVDLINSKKPMAVKIFSSRNRLFRTINYRIAKIFYLGLNLLYKALFRPMDFMLSISYYKSAKRYYTK